MGIQVHSNTTRIPFLCGLSMLTSTCGEKGGENFHIARVTGEEAHRVHSHVPEQLQGIALCLEIWELKQHETTR